MSPAFVDKFNDSLGDKKGFAITNEDKKRQVCLRARSVQTWPRRPAAESDESY